MLYSKQILIKASYDLVVCGGGFSGFASAYTAAKEGLNVVLIEKGGCIGGVGTSGLVNHILGARYIENNEVKTCIGGLYAKLEEKLLEMNGAVDYQKVDLSLPPHGWYASLGVGLIFNNEIMKYVLEEMLTEVGVKILYMTDIIDVITEEERICGVIVHNKSGLYGITGSYFVDATGDADINAMAGLETLIGDDERGMAAASLEMHLENVDLYELTEYMRTTGDIRFKEIIKELKGKGIWKFPYEIFISVLLTSEDTFMINTIRQVGIDGTDGDSISKGITDGRKENFELLEIARNYFPGFKNATIREIAPTIGIRETRRIVGEYTLTVDDLINATDFTDGIALSGYGWDLPDPKKPSHQPAYHIQRASRITQIPYRCLLPCGMNNLITVGRCISVEREVLGPIRVMGPCIAMGEAVGFATALVTKENLSYRDVNIDKLRRKIVANNGIVERK